MPSHHQSPVPSEINARDDRGGHRRLVPARIPREADDAMPATFEVDVVNVLTFESGVDIGVIDTGVVLVDDRPHPFLQGHDVGFEANIDMLDLGDPADSYGHGTFVAGVILREAPSARIHMKASLDVATGKWEDRLVADAIIALGEAGVTLINLSFCGDAFETETPEVIVNALKGLGSEVVVVAAAGNFGTGNPVFPAAVGLDGTGGNPRVIAVGAVDIHKSVNQLEIADFSGWGKWVHAFANGRRVFGPHKDSGWILWSGTSFACATVTGRIAAEMARSSITAKDAAAVVIKEGGPTVEDVDGNSRPYIPSGARPLNVNGVSIPVQG